MSQILAQRQAVKKAGKVIKYGYRVQVAAASTREADDRFLSWVNGIAEKAGHRPVELRKRQGEACA